MAWYCSAACSLHQPHLPVLWWAHVVVIFWYVINCTLVKVDASFLFKKWKKIIVLILLDTLFYVSTKKEEKKNIKKLPTSFLKKFIWFKNFMRVERFNAIFIVYERRIHIQSVIALLGNLNELLVSSIMHLFNFLSFFFERAFLFFFLPLLLYYFCSWTVCNHKQPTQSIWRPSKAQLLMYQTFFYCYNELMIFE